MAVATKEYIFNPNGKQLNMETTKANNAQREAQAQRLRLLSYFVGSSSPIISKLISALISFGCFVTSFVLIVLYRLISIAKIQKYRLLSYLYIKIMAKEIKFNIKLNIDGKEQLVSATSTVENLRGVVNAAKSDIQKANAVFVNFNQMKRKTTTRKRVIIKNIATIEEDDSTFSLCWFFIKEFQWISFVYSLRFFNFAY